MTTIGNTSPAVDAAYRAIDAERRRDAMLRAAVLLAVRANGDFVRGIADELEQQKARDADHAADLRDTAAVLRWLVNL